jgi:hypothetical protein
MNRRRPAAAGRLSGAKYPAPLDAERVEQVGELAVEAGAGFGDGRVGEAGQHRAGLVHGEPGPVADPYMDVPLNLG